jgi:hypothetical protein
MKLGRNAPCWCGSGEKYKRCHLNRQDEQPVGPWEVDAHIRARNKSGKCLHVGATAATVCGKRAIGSHTVAKKMLRMIASNGHVYQHSATMQDLVRTDGQFGVKSIGINDASVLRVFCQAHDSETFVPLEQSPFAGTREQCFLLAYRALCYEFFQKSSVLNSIPTMKGFDRGKLLPQQALIQTAMDALAKGYRLSMRDMSNHKKQYDSMLAAHDYSAIRAYIVSLKDVPDILCSGAIYPVCDFSGQELQNLADFSAKLELITFSLISTDSGGAFVFAWHDSGDSVCRPLATSLDRLADDELSPAIVRFVLEFCENLYMNPAWWDKSDQTIKEALQNRLQARLSMKESRSASCLVDDGVRAISWKVNGRAWL